MTRRAALLAVFATALGKYDAFSVVQAQGTPGTLSINLAQWAGLEVRLGKQRVFISSREIMDSLLPAQSAGGKR